MPFDLATIKSAKLITDPAEVLRRLADLKAHGGSPGATPLERRMAKNILLPGEDDGDTQQRAMILKDIKTVDRAVQLPADEIKALAEARGIKWDNAYLSRAIPYWASDERPDRYGDIVVQEWDLADFRKNPLVLYGHDWNLPPIGNCLREEVKHRSDNDYQGRALWLVALFAWQWEWADTIFRLVEAGFLRTGSVGFFPGTVIDVLDEGERRRLGLGKYGLVYGSREAPNQLIEWTIASVPGNPGAHFISLKNAAEAKAIGPEAAQVVRELARRQVASTAADPEKAWTQQDAALRQLFSAVFPGVKLPEHRGFDVPVFLDELDAAFKGYPAPAPAKRDAEPPAETPGATTAPGEPPAAPATEAKAADEKPADEKPADPPAVVEELKALRAAVDDLSEMVATLKADMAGLAVSRSTTPLGSADGGTISQPAHPALAQLLSLSDEALGMMQGSKRA